MIAALHESGSDTTAKCTPAIVNLMEPGSDFDAEGLFR
jgi:hypothetical protein